MRTIPLLSRWTHRALLLAVLVAGSTALGCAGGGVSRQTPFMQSIDGMDISSRELRFLLDEYQQRVALGLEFSADRIREESDDPAVDLRALQWKAYGVPAVYRAATNPDPWASVIDSWVLGAQMRDYFETGDGRAYFGDHQQIAVEMTHHMIDGIHSIADRANDEGRPLISPALIDSFAAANPIRTPLLGRESIRPLLAKLISTDVKGGLGAVGEINQTVEDLSTRIDLFYESVPKLGRWQGEIVIAEYFRPDGVSTLLSNVDAIDSSAYRISRDVEQIADGIFEVLPGERAIVLATVDEEIGRILAEIDQHKYDTYELVRQERQVVLAAVEQQAEHYADVAAGELNGIVDRIFVRLWIVLIACFLGVLLLGLIFIWVFRRTDPARAPTG